MKKLFVLTFAILFAGGMGMFAQTNENESYYEVTSIQRIMVQAAEEVLSAENEKQNFEDTKYTPFNINNLISFFSQKLNSFYKFLFSS